MLAVARRDPTTDVAGLVGTMDAPADRVSVHVVRRSGSRVRCERPSVAVSWP